MNTKLTSTVLAAGALLAIAPAADAATTFGSRLNHNPANSGECNNLMGPCTIGAFIHPSDPNGDPYSGGAPVDGVITKFRTRIFGEAGAAATVTLKLAEVTRPDPQNDDTAVARLVGTGPTVTVPASDAQDTPIVEFAARLPVRKGQQLALEGTNMWATYNTSGDQFSYVYAPPLVAGQGPRGSTAGTGELLVAADIEPDADGDGFGDETQDACLGSAASAPPCTTTTNNAAKRTVKLQRAAKGRRVGGKCVKPNARNNAKKRCIRYVTLRGSEQAGSGNLARKVTLSKSFAGRKLSPGRYRLVVKGEGAPTKKIGLRIKR